MAMNDRPASGTTTMETLQVPIFPLGLVLFPGAMLPLKIFEQRYLDMTKACVRDDTVFGVCCIRHGQEVGAPAEHEQIGCSARITEWDMPHPNLFHLLAQGDRVFRVLNRRVESNGLIVGTVQWLASDSAGIDADNFDVCRNALQRAAKQIGETIFAGETQFDNPEWVSYRLSELLPIDWPRKQALLEQRSTAQRLAAISAMLQPA